MIVTYPDPGNYQGRQEGDDKVRAIVAQQLEVEPDDKRARQSQSMVRARTEKEKDGEGNEVEVPYTDRSLKFDNFKPTKETLEALAEGGFTVT